MLKFLLPQKAVKAVSNAVGAIFARAKKRFLGKQYGYKDIRFGASTTQRPAEHREDLSLRGVFEAAAKAEGMKPNEKLYNSIEQEAENYFDAHQKLAEAKVTNAVQSFLHNADLGSVKSDPEVLGKELEE